MTLRVVVLAPGFYGYGMSVVRGLRDHGHQACLVEFRRVSTRVGRGIRRYEMRSRLLAQAVENHYERRVKRAISRCRPELLLVTHLEALTPQVVSTCRAHNVLITCWLLDDLRQQEQLLDRLDLVAKLASFSRSDVAALSSARPCTFMPQAFDPHIRCPNRPRSDVMFIGNGYPSRLEVLSELIEANVAKVDIYGYGWESLKGRTGVRVLHPVGRSDALGLLASARVGVNVHREPEAGTNPRAYEIAGVGTLQLSDRAVPGLRAGIDYLAYGSADELVSRVRGAIANPEVADRMAAEARARIMDGNLFSHRVAGLLAAWAIG